jgi:hypothetical protein
MVQVLFPPHLKRHYPAAQNCEVAATTVAEVIAELEVRYPGLTPYIVHENGALRQHVQIFLDEKFIEDRHTLGDSLKGVKQLFVMQALSGG